MYNNNNGFHTVAFKALLMKENEGLELSHMKPN